MGQSLFLADCNSGASDHGPAPQSSLQTNDSATSESAESAEKVRVGYEILQAKSRDEIVVWASMDLTQQEFDAIKLPFRWFKNQPREGLPDNSEFLQSPSASTDGELIQEELYGHTWTHVATVTKTKIPLDEKRLLTGATVSKSHRVTFDANSSLAVLFSPEGKPYVLISRDAQRTQEKPTIPAGWQLVKYTTPDELVFQLPAETLVIRADNKDAFQGPVPELADIR
jgi:hypothetical protein